jgi:hypothetical protein
MEPEDERMLKSLSIIGSLTVEAESDKQPAPQPPGGCGYVILLSGGEEAVYALTVRGRALLNALHAGHKGFPVAGSPEFED